MVSFPYFGSIHAYSISMTSHVNALPTPLTAVRSNQRWPLCGLIVSAVTTPAISSLYHLPIMSGPRDLSPSELERCGLAVLQRRPRSGEPITRVYCLRCGSQVSPDRRDVDPDGWWTCARGCNTKYNAVARLPQVRPTT